MRVVKFLISGGISAAIEFITFLLLITISSLVLSNVISFLVGLIVSFVINKNWVFGYRLNNIKTPLVYAGVAIFNIIAGTIIILLLENNLTPWLAKAVTMILIAIWNYILYSRYIFVDTKRS